MTTARAVWFDQVGRFLSLLKSIPVLKGCLRQDEGHLVITNHHKFDNIVAQTVRENLAHKEAQLDEEDAAMVKKRRTTRSAGRRRAIDNWMKLWVPSERRVVLDVVVDTCGREAETAHDKAKALADHGGPTFTDKPIEHKLAETRCH